MFRIENHGAVFIQPNRFDKLYSVSGLGPQLRIAVQMKNPRRISQVHVKPLGTVLKIPPALIVGMVVVVEAFSHIGMANDVSINVPLTALIKAERAKNKRLFWPIGKTRPHAGVNLPLVFAQSRLPVTFSPQSH